MASYNPNLNQQVNFNDSSGQNRGLFSRILRDLSSWGMKYDDMVAKNRVAIGINEDPNAIKSYGMYDFFSQRAISSLMNRKSVPYLDRAYPDKRRILREYSIKDEIKDFVITIADEGVIYDDNKHFCKVKELSLDYPQEQKDKYNEIFDQIYSAFNFNDGKSAWEYFKAFLVDGYLAFEIVYDDKQEKIIGFEPLDPATLVPGFEPTTGKGIWIQFPEDPQLRRILLDSQIIYMSYKSGFEYGETSYVEGLIRPYNQLKIIEQTRVMFNMVNATVYQKFNIPVQGLSRQRAEEQISQLIADYSEEVEWDDTLGTVSINGTKHLPYNKQLWFPEGETGAPSFELVNPEGHNLNESDMLTWFYNALKRASKIPFSRFDKDNGGGNIYSDASEMTRDEVKFSNFISRLRTTFKEIMNKPLRLQMLIEFPELKEDDWFLNNCGVEFLSDDLFEEWKRLNNMQKRAEIVSNMLGTIQDKDGNPYFHIEFLIDKVLKLTEEEKQENKAYFSKYSNAAGDTSGGEMIGGDPGFGSSADMVSEEPTEDTGMEDLGDDTGGADDAGAEEGGEFEF